MKKSYLEAAKNGSEGFKKNKPVNFDECNVQLTLVINNSFGGFTLSKEALQMIAQKKHLTYVDSKKLYRNDPDLIAVVKELGEDKCSGDVYGFKQPIKMVTFQIHKDKEAVSIYRYDGLEEIYIEDEHKQLYRIDTWTGKRELVKCKTI